jgi:hypothetical protein
LSLDQRAFHAPYKPLNGRGFNCHGAVIFWAGRVNGLNNDRAYALYNRIAEHYNRQVNPNAHHTTSILSGAYGRAFCRIGTALTTPVLNAAEYAVGDVIFTENHAQPMHSMVVVAVSVPNNTVEIRAFNNTGTFTLGVPPPPKDAYDDNTRDLSTRVMLNVPLYKIPGNTFCTKVGAAALLLGFR